MNTSARIDTDVSVMPMRFTDDAGRMRDFLNLLGLAPRVSRRESWIEMVGSSGMLALHSTETTTAPAGQTHLLFTIADADALAGRFTGAGFTDVSIYDEAYGRVVRVVGPSGAELSFDEPVADLYGLQLDKSEPEHDIVSMPILFEPPTTPATEILTVAGFRRLDEGDDQWWRVWGKEGGGLIALHPPTSDRAQGTVQFGFRTREPLAELAARLKAAGHADVTVSGDFGGELTVTDPDGQPVLVQPLP